MNLPERIGPYRPIRRIGTGGMGTVYYAIDPDRDLPLAVKVLNQDFADDPAYRARFRREITTLRKVTGPYLVPLVDADPDAPLPWLATAYIEGNTLDRHVRSHGALADGNLLTFAAAVAHALACIHAAEVAHRDLKPANVILAADGPRVVDFGIAHHLDATAITATSAVTGTPGWMAPEQLTDGITSPACDIFAWGLLVAYAAAAVHPFGVPTGITHRIVTAEPALDGVPEALVPLVSEALRKDPAARPSAAELAERAAAVYGPAGTSVFPTLAYTRIADRGTGGADGPAAVAAALEAGQWNIPLPPKPPEQPDSSGTASDGAAEPGQPAEHGAPPVPEPARPAVEEVRAALGRIEEAAVSAVMAVSAAKKAVTLLPSSTPRRREGVKALDAILGWAAAKNLNASKAGRQLEGGLAREAAAAIANLLADPPGPIAEHAADVAGLRARGLPEALSAVAELSDVLYGSCRLLADHLHGHPEHAGTLDSLRQRWQRDDPARRGDGAVPGAAPCSPPVPGPQAAPALAGSQIAYAEYVPEPEEATGAGQGGQAGQGFTAASPGPPTPPPPVRPGRRKSRTPHLLAAVVVLGAIAGGVTAFATAGHTASTGGERHTAAPTSAAETEPATPSPSPSMSPSVTGSAPEEIAAPEPVTMFGGLEITPRAGLVLVGDEQAEDSDSYGYYDFYSDADSGESAQGAATVEFVVPHDPTTGVRITYSPALTVEDIRSGASNDASTGSGSLWESESGDGYSTPETVISVKDGPLTDIGGKKAMSWTMHTDVLPDYDGSRKRTHRVWWLPYSKYLFYTFGEHNKATDREVDKLLKSIRFTATQMPRDCADAVVALDKTAATGETADDHGTLSNCLSAAVHAGTQLDPGTVKTKTEAACVALAVAYSAGGGGLFYDEAETYRELRPWCDLPGAVRNPRVPDWML